MFSPFTFRSTVHQIGASQADLLGKVLGFTGFYIADKNCEVKG